MKRISILATIVVAIIALSCTQQASDQATASPDSTAAQVETPAAPVTVVTWNEIGVRETPSEKGKYVTSIYLNEHVKLSGDTASEGSGSKRIHYHKVILTDGKSGWVRDEFIAIDVHPAAIIHSSQVYKRPDPATVTEKAFDFSDYVVVKRTEGNFIEVSGKILGDKWYTTGYILATDVYYDEIEVEYAALKRRVNEETKEKIQMALGHQLTDQSIFGASRLWSIDYGGEEEEEEPETQNPEEEVYNIPHLSITPVADGLIGFYPLDDENAEDKSGRGNNGEIFNAQAAGDKVQSAGGAMRFSGSGYITINNKDGADIRPPFSVAAYFKLEDNTGNDECVVSRGRSSNGTGFNFGYTTKTDGTSVFYLGMIGTRPVGAEAVTNIQDGEWVYLAGTFDMKVAKLYVNGELVNTTPISDEEAQLIFENLSQSPQPLEIGRELETLDRYFSGSIDNVGIWNRALNDAEIRSMNKN